MEESPLLRLNMLYSNRRTKFKVSTLMQRETQQDIDQTQHMVLEDRKLFIQVMGQVALVMYMYIHTRTCTCMYIHTCTCIYIHVHTHTQSITYIIIIIHVCW